MSGESFSALQTVKTLSDGANGRLTVLSSVDQAP